MHILVLIAGTNDPSNSALLAQHFTAGLRKVPDVSVTTIRMKDLSLEQFSLKHYDGTTPEESDFRRLREEMHNAHGLVIASPVWNFSVPAHLKNAIDRMGSFGLDATRSRGTLKGLPFYLLFTGGAPVAAWKGMLARTTSHIVHVLQYFGATHCGTHFEGSCTPARGVFGLVVDKRPASLTHMEEEGACFGRLAATYAATGKLPAKKSLLTKCVAILQKLQR